MDDKIWQETKNGKFKWLLGSDFDEYELCNDFDESKLENFYIVI